MTNAGPARSAAARATAILLALLLWCLRGPCAASASPAQSPGPASAAAAADYPSPAKSVGTATPLDPTQSSLGFAPSQHLAASLDSAASLGAQSPQSPYRLAPASADGIGKFYDGREIAQVMGFDGAPWLDRPSREHEERPDLLVRELRLESGMTVADIGAGSGYLSRRMAPLVAPGKVFAVDVQPPMVALLGQLSKQPGMGNLVPVQGAVDDVKLPADSLDLAVMVDVYHELEFPLEVMRSVVRALKPGGRMVFVEYRGEDPKVPIKALHKMSLAQVRLEMRRLPLAWERTAEVLPVQHIIVFRKRER
jgi:ubiquinone/menaquinone biosynthesis C-methylase UbiE